jgi:hypothetical protein
VVTDMTTGLSPDWDRGFDEAFTDLITNDEDLVRAEFDALISASWRQPPPAAPGPSTTALDDNPPAQGWRRTKGD